jgi:ribonuclease/clavin/mitogillin
VEWEQYSQEGNFLCEMPKPSAYTEPMITQSATETVTQSCQSCSTVEPARFKVFYDEQCEVCQAGVSWLRVLDSKAQIDPQPITETSVTDCGLPLEECLRQLHVLEPDGTVQIGWGAVCRLARLFPSTRLIGVLGQLIGLRWFGDLAYGFVARNRYTLSKCRGGACRVAKPERVRNQAKLTPFWSCYTLGFLLRLPLVCWAGLSSALERIATFLRTRQKRIEILDGKLIVLILNGFLPNAVPLLFGELFTAIIYDGAAIDPGSPKMRSSLKRHIAKLRSPVLAVVATHAHEEHVGNLNWLSDVVGAPLYVSSLTAKFLMPFKKLPWVRAAIIGQPPDLKHPFQLLEGKLKTQNGELEVIAAPGHSDDHIVLYDPAEKLLLAGDAFMGTYFATPNPDVDSRKWLATLEQLSELEVEILVEGHGHIHTMRRDVPDFPGVVIRQDPKAAILEKLEYMRWLQQQIEAGLSEGLPLRAVEASCFPWSRRSSWETCATDECIRLLSLGHFSRTELVRSFVRGDQDLLPKVFEVRLHCD